MADAIKRLGSRDQKGVSVASFGRTRFTARTHCYTTGKSGAVRVTLQLEVPIVLAGLRGMADAHYDVNSQSTSVCSTRVQN